MMSDLMMFDFDRCRLDLNSDGHEKCGHKTEREWKWDLDADGR